MEARLAYPFSVSTFLQCWPSIEKLSFRFFNFRNSCELTLTKQGVSTMVLKLSFACWDYDRIKAIEDGRVRVEGIDLTFLNYRVEET
jgi:D-hexose-6-phosphate mutarotase